MHFFLSKHSSWWFQFSTFVRLFPFPGFFSGFFIFPGLFSGLSLVSWSLGLDVSPGPPSQTTFNVASSSIFPEVWLWNCQEATAVGHFGALWSPMKKSSFCGFRMSYVPNMSPLELPGSPNWLMETIQFGRLFPKTVFTAIHLLPLSTL